MSNCSNMALLDKLGRNTYIKLTVNFYLTWMESFVFKFLPAIFFLVVSCTKNIHQLSAEEKMLVSDRWYYKRIDTLRSYSDVNPIYGSSSPIACDTQSWLKFNADGSDSSVIGCSSPVGPFKGVWRLDNDSTIDFILNGNTVIPNPQHIVILSTDSIQLYSPGLLDANPQYYPEPGYYLRYDMNHQK